MACELEEFSSFAFVFFSSKENKKKGRVFFLSSLSLSLSFARALLSREANFFSPLPVLDRAVGLQALQLREHDGSLRRHGLAQPDQRSPADQVNDRVDGRVGLVQKGGDGAFNARGGVGELGICGSVCRGDRGGGRGGGGSRGSLREAEEEEERRKREEVESEEED